MFDKFISKISDELQKPLPGEDAQFIMAPLQRKKGVSSKEKQKAKIASVLILFYPYHESVFVPLILRTSYEGTHSSQVSFPGGQFDPQDEHPETTALRETEEEIGINREKINLIGKLTPIYITPSNFLVHPFVGFANERLDFSIDKTEVEKLLEIDIYDLIDDSKIKIKQIIHRRTGTLKDTPYFDIQNQIIWGATAMIISELKIILENALKRKCSKNIFRSS